MIYYILKDGSTVESELYLKIFSQLHTLKNLTLPRGTIHLLFYDLYHKCINRKYLCIGRYSEELLERFEVINVNQNERAKAIRSIVLNSLIIHGIGLAAQVSYQNPLMRE